MVCDRCIAAVKETLEAHKIPVKRISLGQVQILAEHLDKEKLNEDLEKIGFSLVRDKNEILTERVKALLIDQIHYLDQPLKLNISDYLSQTLQMDYAVVSKIFSQTAHTTIEKFITVQKIEKVKELIEYGELNFSEIAYKLNFSSVAHLSKRFKKVTGMTLSEYKNNNKFNRRPLDKLD